MTMKQYVFLFVYVYIHEYGIVFFLTFCMYVNAFNFYE